MHITVFGASGRVGQHVVRQALQRGHTVTVFLHKTNPFSAGINGLSSIFGDFNDSGNLRKTLKGSDAIISTLGSWGTKNKNTLQHGMAGIIPVAQDYGPRRLISLTGTGARWSGDKNTAYLWANRLPLKLVAPAILKDAEAHIALLEQSDLDWTILRSGRITNDDGSSYTLQSRIGSPFAHASRVSIANCMLDLAESTDYVRQAPVIYSTEDK